MCHFKHSLYSLGDRELEWAFHDGTTGEGEPRHWLMMHASDRAVVTAAFRLAEWREKG